MRFTSTILALLLVSASAALAQPAAPPVPRIETVGTHDMTSDTIGATPGDFRVDEGGAASYSLPIMSVPGTAGLAPKLSLDYNARGATGVLGTGWTLSGQSAFSRCKKTIETGDGPGPHAAVDFNVQDSGGFCLDGQRVFEAAPHAGIACPSISGAQNNIGQYRTEMDPATLICSYATTNKSEIGLWLVFPKDGTMRRYGFAGNSGLRPNDGATGAEIQIGYQIQALDRIADATGNTVDFIYTASVANGELLLSEVKYTGKVANRLDMTGAYTRQPFARTTMIYDTMPLAGQRVDFFGGARFVLRQRLTQINVFGPTNNGANPLAEVQARRYKLDYLQATTGSRIPRLVSVSECVPGSPEVCYPPTRFSWNNEQDNDFPEGYVAPPTSRSYSNLLKFAVDFKVGDINADGRQDLVYIKDRNCTGNPVGERDPFPASATRFRFMVATGNDAGLEPSTNANVFPRRSPPGSTTQIPSCQDSGPASNFDLNQPIRWDLIWYLFDLSGDGRDDLIAQVPDFGTCATCYRWTLFQSEKVGNAWTFSSSGIDLGIASNSDQDANFTDLTGDGLPDLVFGDPQLGLSVRAMARDTGANNPAFKFETATRTVSFIGFEQGIGVTLAFGSSVKDTLRSGDLNGDGIGDLLLRVQNFNDVGFNCGTTPNVVCDPCGGVGQPACIPSNQPNTCQSANDTMCNVNRPERLGLNTQVRFVRTADQASVEQPNPNRGGTLRAYWVTATVTPVGNNFVVSASQCVGGGNNPSACDSNFLNLLSASFVDINGDGLADVFMRYLQSNFGAANQIDRFAYRLNRGGNSGFSNLLAELPTNLSLSVRQADRLQLADINGDKRIDLVYQTTCFINCNLIGFNPFVARRFLSTGFGAESGAVSGSAAVLGNQDPTKYLVLPMDINGDGAADMVRYNAVDGASQNMYVVPANVRYGGNDFIVQFTNGFGVTHKINYAPLVSKFTYERAFDGPRKNFGRNSVVFDVFSPLWAVRDAFSSSPGCAPDALTCTFTASETGATSSIRYSYQGARVQTGGRGFLGFASIRTEDIQNKLLTTTEYRQDYPYIGRPSRTIVQKLTTVITDPCLNDPLNPICFEEPPDNCGGGICPRPFEGQNLRAANLAGQPYRFMSTADPVITDTSNTYTSNPVFAPATQQAIAVYSGSSEEKRYDFATQTLTQRVVTISGQDIYANLFFTESTTFNQQNVQTNRSGHANFYGCTSFPIQVIPGVGCASAANTNKEWARLGRLSMTGTYDVRGSNPINERRSAFEYDPDTLLLVAEVRGVFAPGKFTPEERERWAMRTDYVLDADGNRTLSVSCSVAHFADRTACLDLTSFKQQQWPLTPTKFQRYSRVEYDTLGRFATGSRSPFYSASNEAGVDAYNERNGVTSAGLLNRNVFGDPLSGVTAHGVLAEKSYGPLGREYFGRLTTGAFSRSTYAWCVDAVTTTLPNGTGGASATGRVNCPMGALYRVEGNASENNANGQFIAPRSFTYFDKLGRAMLSTTKMYQSTEADPTEVSRWTSTYTRYDLLGRTKASSEPYFSIDPLSAQSLSNRAGSPQNGITPAETRTQYDALARGEVVELPSESYNGLSMTLATFDRMKTTTSNPRENLHVIEKNGLAEAVRATDSANFAVNYEYEAYGNLKSVTRTPTNGSSAGQAITTSITYDQFGRKLSMLDPDKGLMSYDYNALGELISQTDAKGQTQSLFYDALGRMIERRENRRLDSGSFVSEPTARWIYDDALLVSTSVKAIGLLISENNGLSGTASGAFARSYSYDRFGRSVTAITTLEGTAYTQRTTYDQYGRVFQSFDASTNSASPAGQLQVYSSDGFPIGVREAANGLVGTIYSQVLSLSPRGQVRRERYHESNNLVSDRIFEDNTGRLAQISTGINGSLQRWDYTWDKNGSLATRWDRSNGADFQEAFVYDNLDRLTSVKQIRTAGSATPNALPSLSLAYDQLGNITSKTGAGIASLGAYTYKSSTAQTGCSNINIAGPHAVSQVNGKSYCYDLNGNNTTVRKNGSVIRTIVYTGFDLAETIVRDEMTTDGRIQAQVSFKYGTDRAMFKRTDGAASSGGDQIFKTGFEDNEPPTPVGSGSGKTTFYVGNVEFIREGITSSTKRYIGSYLVITNVGNNPATFDYLLRDSLGSIDTIASETGSLKSRQSFNAHGQRREAATSVNSWSILNPVQSANFNTSTTTQGYTGHEQLDQVGLVHMNARLYDPEIGRFIQADSYVEPEATQGLNRYSYVLNNPLSATDPSGNFSLRQALGVVIGVVAAITGGLAFAAGNLLKSFLIATAGGFASAAIATGSLKAGLWGAVSAAAFWGIGTAFSNMAFANVEAINAGAMSSSQLLKSGLTSGQTIAKIAAHAGAGGVLGVLQGGKFGHGFASAGFTEVLSPAVGQIPGDGFGGVLARTAASAAIGGTASKLSGGSFANGATTGAFQQLFNESSHIVDEMLAQDEVMSDGTGVDMNLFGDRPQDALLIRNAKSFPDTEDIFTIAAHAPDDEKAIFDFTGVKTARGKPQSVFPSALARRTLEHKSFVNGQDILILGCSAGSSGFAASYVRQLRKLGITSNVYAATEGVFWTERKTTYADGRVVMSQRLMRAVNNNQKANFKKYGN
jgi:RHS repeat-associated protein